MSKINIRDFHNENEDGAPDIVGISTFSSTAYFVPTKGTTAQRPSDHVEEGSLRFNTDTSNLEYYRGDTLGWSQFVLIDPDLGGGTGSNTGLGTRGVVMGGYKDSPTNARQNIIDFITVSTLGNAQDFGDLNNEVYLTAACSSRTRAFAIAGETGTTINVIEFVTFASTGNATDFGDIINATTRANSGVSDATRGLSVCGEVPATKNVIEYFTMASSGNAIDFGDALTARSAPATTASSTRAVIAGGRTPSPSALFNSMEFITMSSTGNGTDFGDMIQAVAGAGSGTCSSSVRGLFAGGYNFPSNPYSSFNTIQFITIATLGNTQDFGDLINTVSGGSQLSSPTRGIFAGGLAGDQSTNLATIDTVEILTTGNSTDFGDLTTSRRTIAGASNGHGGL